MKGLGIIVGFLTPALLLAGPVLLAFGVKPNLTSIAGGLCLGLGLVALYYRKP